MPRESCLDLAAYDALKFELATLLRGLRRHYAHSGVAEPEALRDLFARLAGDRFNLTVVGRFSRGKTSLMNAILGTDLLPVGVLPITSVITMVSYGSEPKAVLHYQGSSLFMDIPIAELAEHITERGNPATGAAFAPPKYRFRPSSCVVASPLSIPPVSARRSAPIPRPPRGFSPRPMR